MLHYGDRKLDIVEPKMAFIIHAVLVTVFSFMAGAADANQIRPISWETAKATDSFMPRGVQKAGERVEFLDTGSACSGQFISPDGVFLTDLHCIMMSILNHGPTLRINSGEAAPHFKGWYVKDLTALPFQTVGMPDAYHLDVGDLKDPKVLALGKGYFEFPPDINTPQEFDAISAKFADYAIYQEDFSILKFDLSKKNAHPCIAMSTKDPSSGDEAWAIGFPEEAYDNGRTPEKFVTKAKVFLTLAELKANQVVTYPEEAWFDSTRYFLLAGQVIPGMSGGAILNQNGELIGTIVGRTRSGDTIAMKASFVSAAAKKLTNESLICPN